MTHTDADRWFSTRIRMSLVTAGLDVKQAEDEVNLHVLFEDNTRLAIGFNNSEIAVARVMPSGNVTGQAEFRGLPLDFVVAAIVAMAKEA